METYKSIGAKDAADIEKMLESGCILFNVGTDEHGHYFEVLPTFKEAKAVNGRAVYELEYTFLARNCVASPKAEKGGFDALWIWSRAIKTAKDMTNRAIQSEEVRKETPPRKWDILHAPYLRDAVQPVPDLFTEEDETKVQERNNKEKPTK